MANTSKLGLPLLANGAANQTLANATFALINQLLMAGVVDKDLSTPPSSPANESLYIVASGNWGTASSKAGQLAFWLTDVGAWTFIVPRAGWAVRVLDELDGSGLPLIYGYTGSAWVQQPSSGGGGGGAVSSVNGQTGAVLLPADNLLINPLFRINQRGYASGTATTAANQYTLDRWRVVTSGQSLSFSASGIGNEVTAPAGGIEQVIEDLNIQGGVYTLSWVGSATATVNGTAISNGGQTASLTAGTNVTIRFTGGTVREAKFELGAVATPFRSLLYSADLLLCQRYCVVYTLGNGEGLAIGTATASTSAYSWMLLPTTVRTASAAVTVSAGMTFYDPSSRSGTIAGKLQTPFMLQIAITATTGLTPGGSGYFAWASGGKITIDAEL